MNYFFWTYGILIICILISVAAQIKISASYSKYRKVASSKGYTGYTAAREILDRNGLAFVNIEMISGKLSDHFDPRQNVIRLSQDVYNGNSVAAIGVAAHECGHAIQYDREYIPMKLRNSVVKTTSLCSTLSFVLILLGVFISVLGSTMGEIGGYIINAGIIAYAVIVVFQLITLPVEFNASKRALSTIDEYGIVSSEEKGMVANVLTSAALTYLAAFVVSLLQLLRLIMIFGGRRN